MKFIALNLPDAFDDKLDKVEPTMEMIVKDGHQFRKCLQCSACILKKNAI